MIKGFISYAHDDYSSFKKICTHIKSIERALPGKIEFWADTRIRAGDYWTAQIEAAISEAQFHLLLISAEFLAADYIADYELPAINAKYSDGDLVVPVILKGCIWVPFVGPLQAVPTSNGRVLPICDWSPRNNGFYNATEQILGAITTRFGISVNNREWRRT